MATLTPVLPEQEIESDADVSLIPPYKVILLDDPVTTMDFVVAVLVSYFQKDQPTAMRLMWEVHTTGASHVATLSLEQAEMKQAQVHHAAQVAGFPFRCVIEPA